MARERPKQILGIILMVVGLLFLFVSNHLILGWEDVWPLFPLLSGIFFMKLYSARKEGELIFTGTALLLIGVFFILFTFKILKWTDMELLWPTFPLIGGISFLTYASTRKHPTSPLIVGIAAILFGLVSYLYTAQVISRRVAEPFVRLWPLILIIAGIFVFLKAREQTGGLDLGGTETPDKARNGAPSTDPDHASNIETQADESNPTSPASETKPGGSLPLQE